MTFVYPEEWIRDHGSERLKQIVRLGLLDNSMAVYRDERLAHARPGWRWLRDGDEERDILNPSVEALDALEKARELDPNVELVFLVTGDGRKGPALVAPFLDDDRYIVYELDGGKGRLEQLVETVYEGLTSEFAAQAHGIVLDDAHKKWLRERARNTLARLQGELR